MASLKEKIDSLQQQDAANQRMMVDLRQHLDDAADAGNAEEIAAIQNELAARATMAGSYERRLAKLQGELSDEGRVELKAANLKRADVVQAELEAAARLAAEVDATLALLAGQLGQIHQHGRKAFAEAHELVRQLPGAHGERMYSLLQTVGLRDSFLGSLLEGELVRYGVFRDLAPLPSVQLSRHDLGILSERFAERAEKLPRAVAKLAERVNQEL